MSSRQLARVKRPNLDALRVAQEAQSEDNSEDDDNIEEEVTAKVVSGFSFLDGLSDDEEEEEQEEKEGAPIKNLDGASIDPINKEVVYEVEEVDDSLDVVDGTKEQRRNAGWSIKSNSRSKKKSNQGVAQSLATNEEDFDFLTELQPSNETGDEVMQVQNKLIKWLNINLSDLSLDAVLLRRFGAAVIHDNNDNKKHKKSLRKYIFGPPKPEWNRPPHLIAKLEETDPPVLIQHHLLAHHGYCQWYNLVWSDEFTRIHSQYLLIQKSGDVNLLVTFLSHHPYHIEGLLQLSMVFARTGYMDKASECVKLCLYILEHWLPDSSKLQHGICRFDASVPANVSLFTALFRHAQLSCMLGCPTVSAATTILLLSLDPIQDPFHSLLCLDFYLLAAGRHDVIDEVMREHTSDTSEIDLVIGPSTAQLTSMQFSPDAVRGIDCLPNWTFSHAVSYFLREDFFKADGLLVKALRRFPFMLKPILLRIDVNIESVSPLDWRFVCSHDFFRLAQSRFSHCSTYERLSGIYAARNRSFWQRDGMTRWLYKCSSKLLTSLDSSNGDNTFIEEPSPEVFEKYALANDEDFLDEFPRLPPEANPLDPRFLVAGAPVLLPPQQDMAGRNHIHLEGVDLAQQLRLLDQIEEHRRGNNGFLNGAENNGGNLGPHLPLLQLFLQTLMPWNRFDSRARDE